MLFLCKQFVTRVFRLLMSALETFLSEKMGTYHMLQRCSPLLWETTHSQQYWYPFNEHYYLMPSLEGGSYSSSFLWFLILSIVVPLIYMSHFRDVVKGGPLLEATSVKYVELNKMGVDCTYILTNFSNCTYPFMCPLHLVLINHHIVGGAT